MVFDPNPHLFRKLIIDFGKIMFPGEKNITVLYEKVSALLGIPPFKMGTRTSEYDASYLLIRSTLTTAGEKLREARGLPTEPDLNKLFEEAAVEFGMESLKPELPKKNEWQETIRKLPAPHEMKDEQGKFVIPRKDCPQCGRKDGLSLKDICPSCADSEGGKYLSWYTCEELGPDGKIIGCGFKTEKSEKRLSQRMSERDPNWRGGMKKDLGIKTSTDNGLK
jgi:hypothetical protein